MTEAGPEADGLGPLTPDHGCCNRLNWRCEMPQAVDPGGLVEALVRRLYQLRCDHSGLKVLRHPRRHEIAWVERSGRVQIRIDRMLEPEEREQAALQVHRELTEVVSGLGGGEAGSP